MAPGSRGERIGRRMLVCAALLMLGLLAPGCSGDEGADLYAAECARCHGSDRAGVDGVAPDLSKTSFALEETDVWLSERIGHGYRNMPRFTPTLTEGQISAVVAFLRHGGEAAPSSPAVTTTTQMPDDEELARGRAIFEFEAGSEGEGCAGCHASDGAGTTEGPGILGASKWGISDALERVVEMEDIVLSPEDLEAVYRYLVFLSEGR